ncbi:hypothetical protein VTK56DRAFT_5280 [Thermocarpiscus australiensis]
MERSGIFIVPPYLNRTPSRRLTRRSNVQPATIFVPEDGNLSPEVHFPLQTVFAPDRPPYPRFVNRFNSREMLLVVDGSCINNGRHADKGEPPVAGCSFMFKGTPSTALNSPRTPVTFPFLSKPGPGDHGQHRVPPGAGRPERRAGGAHVEPGQAARRDRGAAVPRLGRGGVAAGGGPDGPGLHRPGRDDVAAAVGGPAVAQARRPRHVHEPGPVGGAAAPDRRAAAARVRGVVLAGDGRARVPVHGPGQGRCAEGGGAASGRAG